MFFFLLRKTYLEFCYVVGYTVMIRYARMIFADSCIQTNKIMYVRLSSRVRTYTTVQREQRVYFYVRFHDGTFQRFNASAAVAAHLAEHRRGQVRQVVVGEPFG